MKSPEITTYTALGHLLSAFINGDESGLEESELSLVRAFAEQPEHDLRNGHWSCPSGDDGRDEDRFACCDVTGEWGACQTLEWVDMRPFRA